VGRSTYAAQLSSSGGGVVPSLEDFLIQYDLRNSAPIPPGFKSYDQMHGGGPSVNQLRIQDFIPSPEGLGMLEFWVGSLHPRGNYYMEMPGITGTALTTVQHIRFGDMSRMSKRTSYHMYNDLVEDLNFAAQIYPKTDIDAGLPAIWEGDVERYADDYIEAGPFTTNAATGDRTSEYVVIMSILNETTWIGIYDSVGNVGVTPVRPFANGSPAFTNLVFGTDGSFLFLPLVAGAGAPRLSHYISGLYANNAGISQAQGLVIAQQLLGLV
jgi:hypothetical protein